MKGDNTKTQHNMCPKPPQANKHKQYQQDMIQIKLYIEYICAY